MLRTKTIISRKVQPPRVTALGYYKDFGDRRNSQMRPKRSHNSQSRTKIMRVTNRCSNYISVKCSLETRKSIRPVDTLFISLATFLTSSKENRLQSVFVIFTCDKNGGKAR
ncbi:hypothetical protein NPIL_133601 [Nephila pilipes]|uniref:Uncharacterized protein n=1 Tax=Nephila pilipes TaxID=299642 RepID=A0A8X6P2X6_NEPPI|nr:hypothetical protein NPIL_133601 [Nephila pilipes]